MISDYISRIQSQYGRNALLYLEVSPFKAVPIINRTDMIAYVRSSETATIVFTYVDPTGVVYNTQALLNNHRFYELQAGESSAFF